MRLAFSMNRLGLRCAARANHQGLFAPEVARLNRGISIAAIRHATDNRLADNLLTVTGNVDAVAAFRSDATGPSPGSLPWLPRGLAFSPGDLPELSFQRLLPVEPHKGSVERASVWGSPADATEVKVSAGWPKSKGRTSVTYQFRTGAPPLRWLEAAAVKHPSLRFGYKYAIPQARTAYEMEFQQARLIHKTQVSYSGWVWNHKARKPDLFADLKDLLRFPDGRVPKKRKLKVPDVEARLHAEGTYSHALALLSAQGGGTPEEGALRRAPHRQRKIFHTAVLPEFVAWLRSGEGSKVAA